MFIAQDLNWSMEMISDAVKTNNYKQISFHSLKNYLIENFEQEPKNITFPNYERFSDVDSAYNAL